MSHRAPIQTILARASQFTRGDGPLLAPDPVERTPAIPPSHQPHFFRPFAWLPREDDSRGLAVRFTHRLLLQPFLVASSHKVGSGVIAPATSTCALQTDVSIERQFSRIFPAHPRSLARCLSHAPSPHHATTAWPGTPILRHGTALLFRLSENLFGTTPHRTRTKRFSEPSENAPFGLGSGAHSRRFAQECPEGNPGKYIKEK